MRVIALIGSFLWACTAAAGEPVSLSAPAGGFSAAEGPVVGTRGEMTAALKITSMADGPKWAPGAVLGFSEGPPKDHSNSIQFVLFRNMPADNFLTFGYRLLKSGSIAKQQYLDQHFEVGVPVKVAVSFNNGAFTYTAGAAHPVSIDTELKRVRNYLSVDSAAADFADLVISGDTK
jgi:hypothetical protein